MKNNRKSQAAPLVALLVALAAASPARTEEPAPANPQKQELDQLIGRYRELYRQQQFAEARPLAERALTLAEAVFGPEEEATAQVLNDLGYLHQSMGEPDKAEPLHRRALAIRERVFKSDGPNVVQSLNNLAKACRALGRDAEAAPLFKRSLDILERYLPPAHPQILSTLEGYAASLRGAARVSEAEAVEARIKAMRPPAKAGSP